MHRDRAEKGGGHRGTELGTIACNINEKTGRGSQDATPCRPTRAPRTKERPSSQTAILPLLSSDWCKGRDARQANPGGLGGNGFSPLSGMVIPPFAPETYDCERTDPLSALQMQQKGDTRIEVLSTAPKVGEHFPERRIKTADSSGTDKQLQDRMFAKAQQRSLSNTRASIRGIQHCSRARELSQTPLISVCDSHTLLTSLTSSLRPLHSKPKALHSPPAAVSETEATGKSRRSGRSDKNE